MTLTAGDAGARRDAMRGRLGIAPDTVCVGFFGKLIPKKDPELLLRMGAAMNAEEKRRTTFLFVGSGELEVKLRSMADACGLKALFAGFVNQKEIPDYYIATDIVMLPSRRMGETWGLVVNEALAAGCRVIVSNAVGCHAEFKSLPTVRVIPVGRVDVAIRKFRELVVDIRATVRLRSLPSVFTKEVVARQITSAVNRHSPIL
jgi:glycosyltransferase involved in cell wall biosynthesis